MSFRLAGSLIIVVVAAAGAFGLVLLGLQKGAMWPLVVAPLGFLFLAYFMLRGPLAHWRASKAPLRSSIEEHLAAHVAQYGALEGDRRARFLRRVQVLVDTLVFESVPGVTFDEEAKVLAVAGAALLVQGHDDYEFKTARSVLLYPDHFDGEYDVGADNNIAGMVHHQGPIIFSKRALTKGWDKSDDAYNVSIHEWAHVLDFDDGYADGIPGFATDYERWNELLVDELARAKAQRSTALSSYAGTNRAETFAVAMEVFFERPRKLRRKNEAFYELLVETFQITPIPETK